MAAGFVCSSSFSFFAIQIKVENGFFFKTITTKEKKEWKKENVLNCY
jgi:hypothetical protein